MPQGLMSAMASDRMKRQSLRVFSHSTHQELLNNGLTELIRLSFSPKAEETKARMQINGFKHQIYC